MHEILGTAKTVRELLKGVKYSIDYYQREYKWRDIQVRELIDDLSGKFLEDYQPDHNRKKVALYPHYFLGSIIISSKDGANHIVDGQQRLTTLSLLLILLRHLQQGCSTQVNIDELIVSEKYGEKSFNLDVEERASCMRALYDGAPFDTNGHSESVRNLCDRYADLEAALPEELRQEALPFFIDWLLENVHMVEITAYSDDDAYTIFETMNDRGLSLSPTEMLKGYLLASIADPSQRDSASDLWRQRIRQLNEAGKEVEADFFKNWLRSQYSSKIRERKRNAKNEDFDRIGTAYHRWLREASPLIGLSTSDDFYRFIQHNFDFFTRQYLRLVWASRGDEPRLNHVFCNAQLGFTLQYMLALAPLVPDDSDDTCILKQRVVARYLDILLAWRVWNFRSIAYSTLQYAMFNMMKAIRGLGPKELADELHKRLLGVEETFDPAKANHDSGVGLYLHQQNKYSLHRMLARLTDYVETSSGRPTRYAEYVSTSIKDRFEIEHVWANDHTQHIAELPHPADFAKHRNRFGALLLLPKSFNASYGKMPYAQKLEYYRMQSNNLLAQSLHSDCYSHDPGFVRFLKASGLPFVPHPQFRLEDIGERGELYRQIAGKVWDPEDLLGMVKS